MSPEVSPPPPPSRRTLLRAGALGALGTSLSACGFMPARMSARQEEAPIDVKVDGDLVYFNWADYVDPSVFKGFQKEYGVDVIQSNFDSMEGMVAKLNAGNRYDVVFPSAKWAQRLVRGRMLRRIDHSKLTQAPSVFGRHAYFADPWYDRDSAHTVPFTAYKTGIGWRKDLLGDLGDSWKTLWNPRAKGKVFLLDDRDEVLGMAALALGLDVATGDRQDLDRITSLLGTLRPNLRGFASDDYGNLLNGNAVMTQAWSGDIAAILNQAKDPTIYGFHAPREGAPINSDCYAIPVNARHPGTAMLFIDYMLRPENVRKNIAYIGYPMPVAGTEKTYAELVAPFPECVVTEADLKADLFFRNGTRAQENARDTAWTHVKAG
ncbi:spermidine/putrescine ABC transporter substrate-binding protein [Streptomyces sp. NPDC048664]|uniref:polyamine ABC transporter substrate-binding protein n=1 Tax=Streptomyces sp. NPDC048664 TaxID=3154505 RepID=UPI003427184B